MYYETVFIVHPDLSKENASKLVDELVGRIEKSGGRVVKRESWGLRPLAYRIANRRRGHYFLLVVDGEPAVQQAFERDLRLNERVIRWLSVRIDEVSEKPSPIIAPREEAREGGERAA